MCTGVPGGVKSPKLKLCAAMSSTGYGESNPFPLEEQYVLLSTEPPPLPQKISSLYVNQYI